ncbi:MAG: hypothetical protein JJU36_02365 [Phycisphaeraceae bacterium]|nr:hypothetical protein [Phycisphaeraceae bacterium]
MKRNGGFGLVAGLLAMICLAGCGGERSSEPTMSGDKLKAHLLEILESRRAAMLEGDLAKARTFNLPYANAEAKVFWELIGRSWDAVPTEADLEAARDLPVLFSGTTPIKIRQAGDWAHLLQVDDDRASNAYFLLRDEKWWVVSAYFGDARPAMGDGFDDRRAETYWPDHIADYFLLPQVKLEIAPTAEPIEHPFHNMQLSLHVTNTSDASITEKAMYRRFRSVQYVIGTSQSAVEPSGGEAFRQVKPGERFFVGNVQLRVPEDKESEIVFYVGPYTSNRIRTP